MMMDTEYRNMSSKFKCVFIFFRCVSSMILLRNFGKTIYILVLGKEVRSKSSPTKLIPLFNNPAS